MGFVAPQHVGSSGTRDRTHVPCIGRQIPNHCATREVLDLHFVKVVFGKITLVPMQTGGVGEVSGLEMGRCVIKPVLHAQKG